MGSRICYPGIYLSDTTVPTSDTSRVVVRTREGLSVSTRLLTVTYRSDSCSHRSSQEVYYGRDFSGWLVNHRLPNVFCGRWTLSRH